MQQRRAATPGDLGALLATLLPALLAACSLMNALQAQGAVFTGTYAH